MMLIGMFGTGSSGWSPLQLPSIHAAYDPTDPSKLWQDAARTVPVTTHNDPVWTIDDITGNGHHLYAPNSTGRGLWQSTVGILMDGVDDLYVETLGSTLPLPFYLAVAYFIDTGSTRGEFFNVWGGSSNYAILDLGSNQGRSRIRIAAGTVPSVGGTVGGWVPPGKRVFDSLHTFGTSDAQVNNEARNTIANPYVPGDQLAGFLAVANGTAVTPAKGIFHGAIVSRADPGSMRADAKAWLAARGGITL